MALVVTVSQINRRLALMLKGDKDLQNISVRGEISNLKYHTSGHIYFSVRDDSASIKAVMFRSYAEKLNITLENGMNVVVTGAVQFYERDGVCQLYAYSIDQEEGVGDGALSFEQLKNKLNEEGLFEQKRPLPEIPRSICVVTSETGAAIKDIMNVLSRRYPFVKVKLISVLVQGAEAPESIADGINKAQDSGCDLIIFGRGGGSAEDLSAFNAEVVARAVFASKIPTISAVGHEIDFSISDFVADVRAATPSAAAEIAVPDINDIMNRLEAKRDRIREMALDRIAAGEMQMNNVFSHIELFHPKNKIESDEKNLNRSFALIKKDFANLISKKEMQLKNTAELVDAFDPFKTLERGYSIVFKDNAAIISVNSLKEGDKIKIKLSDGEINALITQ
ncbi:MAG: exodeoxyribonuclease VII large subunit [Ruminococcaceae bacterium]|nr:exodeoxyribonuclease VII large subunit [Oscillospiraceae bacterium]